MDYQSFFSIRVQELNLVIDNEQELLKARMLACIELYRIYQHDVHSQAKTISRLDLLIKEMK